MFISIAKLSTADSDKMLRVVLVLIQIYVNFGIVIFLYACGTKAGGKGYATEAAA